MNMHAYLNTDIVRLSDAEATHLIASLRQDENIDKLYEMRFRATATPVEAQAKGLTALDVSPHIMHKLETLLSEAI